VFIGFRPFGKMVRQFLPSGLRFLVRQLLDQTVGLHDPVDRCLHGLLPENAIVNAATEPLFQCGALLEMEQ
jgi:hypothetical protein